jgi:hypothetical protein
MPDLIRHPQWRANFRGSKVHLPRQAHHLHEQLAIAHERGSKKSWYMDAGSSPTTVR